MGRLVLKTSLVPRASEMGLYFLVLIFPPIVHICEELIYLVNQDTKQPSLNNPLNLNIGFPHYMHVSIRPSLAECQISYMRKKFESPAVSWHKCSTKCIS